ncbi:hypothetical protein H6F43_05565, partial [Leptolyngbya sp. FACHB-36]|nr:hypothetical protein [Leptolyngbya sp. FACHB-36]
MAWIRGSTTVVDVAALSPTMLTSDRALDSHFIVTADQMRQIEERLFAAGMPVAALM